MNTLLALLVVGAMGVEEGPTTLTVQEDGQPVLVYHRAPNPELPAPRRMVRAGYVHPLYGLDGDVLTQDLPLDHLHHRGMYFAWPEAAYGARDFDIWHLEGVRPRVESATHRTAGESVVLAFDHRWSFDTRPEQEIVDERVTVVVHPAEGDTRAIDVTGVFTNKGERPFRLLGADDKGYGGFNIRPDARRKPLTFHAASGVIEEDVLELDSPWAAVTSTNDEGVQSGVAVFQHPENPDYPHDGWILRHYGFLGASWPHLEPYVLEPGESVTLRYRVLVYRGDAARAGVAQAHAAYVSASE